MPGVRARPRCHADAARLRPRRRHLRRLRCALHPAVAEVLATAGDDQLGGKDWDDALLDLIADRIEAKCGIDARDDDQLVTHLLERTRDAQHALSRVNRTAVTVPVGGAMQRVEVTRAEFEAVASSLYTWTEAVVDRVIADIGGRSKLDAVLLVGGSSRMPRCPDALVSATGLDPRTRVDPDAAVAIGAAVMATDQRAAGPSALARRRPVRDATAHALGFVVVSAEGSRYVNEIMIARNSPISVSQTKTNELAVGRDDSGVLDVYMLQGEAERPMDTNPVGRWTFEGVPGNRQVRSRWTSPTSTTRTASAMSPPRSVAMPLLPRGSIATIAT